MAGSDVLARLMRWMETSEIDDAGIVLRDAITEIAGLRARLHGHRIAIRRLADQDATLSVCDGNVIVEMDATLTDAEREAIAYFAVIDGPQYLPAANEAATTLRVLLERTK